MSASRPAFQWDDALLLDSQLTEEEFAKAINNLDFGNGFCPENYDFFLRNYSIEAATCKLKTLLE